MIGVGGRGRRERRGVGRVWRERGGDGKGRRERGGEGRMWRGRGDKGRGRRERGGERRGVMMPPYPLPPRPPFLPPDPTTPTPSAISFLTETKQKNHAKRKLRLQLTVINSYL